MKQLQGMDIHHPQRHQIEKQPYGSAAEEGHCHGAVLLSHGHVQQVYAKPGEEGAQSRGGKGLEEIEPQSRPAGDEQITQQYPQS